MDALLKDISVIPGVLGSCVFDRSDGLLCREQHPVLSEELTRTVGNHLIRLFQMAAICDMDIQSTSFDYEKYVVVALPLREFTVLFTVCSSQANCSLVTSTAQMLLDDMRKELERRTGIAIALEDDIEDLAAFDLLSEQAETEQDDDLLLIRPYLRQIEQTLASVIGPVAAIVMEEYITKWRQAGPANRERLMLLATMASSEIDDPVLEKEFMLKIADML